MWLLRGSRRELYYLIVGKSHVVGRKDGDLVLSDDQSISRRHAVITVVHSIKDLGNPSQLPVVSLTDTGSKYGTYINDGIKVLGRMIKDSPVVLKDGDHIRFGLQWNDWRLDYSPLVVTTSTLTPDGKRSLGQQLVMLGGHLVNSWQDTVTHVTMCNLTLTVKVVCALANGKPIVTPQYWDNYITALSTKQPLPDCKDYIPPLAETTLNVNEVSFDVNENRKKLFVGKHFVFSSSHQYNLYSCMVTAAGGRAGILEECGLVPEDLVQPNVIVMQYSFVPSQGSQVPHSFQEVTKYLKSRGKRIIPESDVGLAILYCSIDRHCNPDYKVASVLMSRVTREVNSHNDLVLALDTQESELENMKKIKEAAKGVVIPASGTVQKPAGPSVSAASASKYTHNWESVDTENEVFVIPTSRVEKERLSVRDELDASLRPNKRYRSMEDDGFLRTRAATPVCSQASIILGRDGKTDSDDDENLFEFPSDKKLRLAPCRLVDEEDEDMFAFADEIKPKSFRAHSKKDEPAESCGLPRKRKSQNSEIISEPSSLSKRCATEKDVLQQQNTDSHKIEPIWDSVTTHEGFLSVVDETKENTALEKSMMDLTDDLKCVTVVEVKDLISRTAVPLTACATTRHVGANFKKFRKVRAANHYSLITSQDLIPYDADTKSLSERLSETHAEYVVEDDHDWAFVEPAQTDEKKTEARHR